MLCRKAIILMCAAHILVHAVPDFSGRWPFWVSVAHALRVAIIVRRSKLVATILFMPKISNS